MLEVNPLRCAFCKMCLLQNLRSCRQTNPLTFKFLPSVKSRDQAHRCSDPSRETSSNNSGFGCEFPPVASGNVNKPFFVKLLKPIPNHCLSFSELKADRKQIKGQLSKLLLRFNISLHYPAEIYCFHIHTPNSNLFIGLQ